MERWNGDELLQEAVRYFSSLGFRRLLEGLREKYQSLSRLGGKIIIPELTEEEAESLEGFLQMEIKQGQKLSVSVRQINKAMERTRFAGCSLETLITMALNDRLVSNKDRKTKEEEARERQFREYPCSFQGTPAGTWLEGGLLKGSALNTLMMRDYHSSPGWLKEQLPVISDGLNRLPVFSDNHLRLPVFAASITGNPHYFDEGKRSLTYLLHGIRTLLGESSLSKTALEGRTELLYRAGIIKDDLYNWVLCFGVRGYLMEGQLHRGMEEYVKRSEPQILTLQNLSILKSAAAVGQQVYVVENPAVFSALTEQKQSDFTCICSGGQLRLAVLVLLDLLAEGGSEIYYSGDFDPEGLDIAQKLVSRYGNQLKLWCYETELYHKSMSSETISESRLKMLNRLTDKRLAAIGTQIKEYRHPGYQENIMEQFF